MLFEVRIWFISSIEDCCVTYLAFSSAVLPVTLLYADVPTVWAAPPINPSNPASNPSLENIFPITSFNP